MLPAGSFEAGRKVSDLVVARQRSADKSSFCVPVPLQRLSWRKLSEVALTKHFQAAGGASWLTVYNWLSSKHDEPMLILYLEISCQQAGVTLCKTFVKRFSVLSCGKL